MASTKRGVKDTRLQPYHVFLAELTRLNSVYWTTKFSLERIPAILEAISSTAADSDDPPLSSLWGSADPDMAKQLTIPISTFRERAEMTVLSVRSLSIIGICSAFENALVNYFCLACLYNPKKGLQKWDHQSAPKILKNGPEYKKLKKKASERASEILKAGYGIRIRAFLDLFGIDRTSLTLPDGIKEYYQQRHLLAHNQGVEEDGPWIKPETLMAQKVTLDESDWKKMLKDFQSIIVQIDELVQTVVPSKALHIALLATMIEIKKPIKLGALMQKINSEWHLLESHASIQKAAKEVGFSVSSDKQLIRRVVHPDL